MKYIERRQMRINKLFFISITIFLFLVKSVYSKEIVMFGTPLVKVESTLELTQRFELNARESSKYVVAIEFDGKDFRWKTRENKILKYSKAGAFHYFVNESGSGYVKVGDLSKMGGAENQYLYLEHIHLGFSTITYWGTVDSFKMD